MQDKIMKSYDIKTLPCWQGDAGTGKWARLFSVQLYNEIDQPNTFNNSCEFVIRLRYYNKMISRRFRITAIKGSNGTSIYNEFIDMDGNRNDPDNDIVVGMYISNNEKATVYVKTLASYEYNNGFEVQFIYAPAVNYVTLHDNQPFTLTLTESDIVYPSDTMRQTIDITVSDGWTKEKASAILMADGLAMLDVVVVAGDDAKLTPGGIVFVLSKSWSRLQYITAYDSVNDNTRVFKLYNNGNVQITGNSVGVGARLVFHTCVLVE